MELHERLLARRAEIEQAVLTRVNGVSDPTEASDPTYLEGLRTAVAAAVDYGIEGVRSSERNPPQVPPTLLVQARVAASNRVGLDTVLRRYFAGYALLGDFLIEEAEGMLVGDALKRVLRAQAAVFDRLLAAVSEEHARQSQARHETAEQRRAELVQRLLGGERLDAAELAYDFEATHLGLVAKGPGAAAAVRELAAALDRRLLLVCPEEQTVWAWLGGRREVEPAELDRLLAPILPASVALALGEPGERLDAWRLTHHQARAALPIALRGAEPFVRYSEIALLASVLRDDLLITSLREMYLAPLERERDGGEVARETLRAYFASECNVSSAAAALGVNRKTITSRLRSIESLIGHPFSSRVTDIETALRIEELGDPALPHPLAG